MPTSAMAFCVTAIVAFFAPNGTTTEPDTATNPPARATVTSPGTAADSASATDGPSTVTTFVAVSPAVTYTKSPAPCR